MTDLAPRYAAARRIAAEAGAMALDFFQNLDQLTIDVKGHQDFVSEANKTVEPAVRAALAEVFPDDGIAGEEGAPSSGTSGYTWVIDPINGTTNFINGIPQWCVILACVHQVRTVIGVVHDPVHDGMHHAVAGGGGLLQRPSHPLFCQDQLALGVGFSGRTHIEGIKRLASLACNAGTVFWRNGSGGLSLA